MRSSACVMRLRTAEVAETAFRMASRRCSCWRSTSSREVAAAEASCCRGLRFLLRMGNLDIGRFERGAIGFQFLLQARELRFGVGDLGLRCGGARIQFGAALVVGAAAGGGTIDLQRKRVELLAVLLRLALDGIAALRALAVLAFHLLHGFALRVHGFADFRELAGRAGKPRHQVARTC